MQSEDKIYGLIAQAEDIQGHAVLQQVAQEAIKTLPEATRGAVRDAAREIIVEGTEKASRSLLDASSRATAASEQLRGASAAALIKHVTVLSLVALVISAAIYFGLGFLVKRRAAELDQVTTQARAMQEAVNKLNSQYAKAQFSTCGGRPCVRVDEQAGRYGAPTPLYGVVFQAVAAPSESRIPVETNPGGVKANKGREMQRQFTYPAVFLFA